MTGESCITFGIRTTWQQLSPPGVTIFFQWRFLAVRLSRSHFSLLVLCGTIQTGLQGVAFFRVSPLHPLSTRTNDYFGSTVTACSPFTVEL